MIVDSEGSTTQPNARGINCSDVSDTIIIILGLSQTARRKSESMEILDRVIRKTGELFFSSILFPYSYLVLINVYEAGEKR